jgi:predicted CopG family antitoxin
VAALTLIVYGCPYITMSKNISISEEVYRRLKREKGDRSFSEIIAERLEAGSRLADVTGEKVLEGEAAEAASRDIEELGQRTLARLVDEDS